MTETPRLRDLARLYRFQTVYRDGFGRLRQAPSEAVLSALRSFGAPIDTLSDLPDAWRQTRQTIWRRVIEPVLIAWEGKPFLFKLRIPQRLAEAPVHGTVVLETGERIESACVDEKKAPPRVHDVEGALYFVRRLCLPVLLPLGYHRFNLQIGDRHWESHLFSSPQHAYVPAETNGKRWGVFCPLYALWSKRSWGAGNFTDLENLVDFVAAQQGHAVATLPMLASYLDEPFNPSPYAPVSRLFDNEFYLDVNRIPELGECRSAQAMLHSAQFESDLQRARSASLIDYRGEMALKRKVLEELLRFFLKEHSPRRESFEKFVTKEPRVQDYASFRAKVERERKGWLNWERSRRDGILTANDYDEAAKRYHLYVQWLCAEQTNALHAQAKDRSIGLYLDFPLGVNRDGYDVWRERELFVLNASAGAPPDELFVRGQNWGFPPLHTEAIRRQGYRYYIDCLRHHMALSAMLRIDHVMGLQREFWVPHGFDATAGLYVYGHAA